MTIDDGENDRKRARVTFCSSRVRSLARIQSPQAPAYKRRASARLPLVRALLYASARARRRRRRRRRFRARDASSRLSHVHVAATRELTALDCP